MTFQYTCLFVDDEPLLKDSSVSDADVDALAAQTLGGSKHEEREEDVFVEEEEETYDNQKMMSMGAVLEATSTVSSALAGDEDDDYPLEDDPDDPNYQKQKELLQKAIAESDRVERDRNFDAMDFMMNHMNEDQMKEMDELPFTKEVIEQAQSLQVSERDVEGLDIDKELRDVPDLMDDDPYPRHEEGEENFLEKENGITDDDMENLDNMWKTMKEKTTETPWDKVMTTQAKRPWNSLPEETREEMEECLYEIGGSSYNTTKWLLYDLDFNVSNLMLAAVKHNRDAPFCFTTGILSWSLIVDTRAHNKEILTLRGKM